MRLVNVDSPYTFSSQLYSDRTCAVRDSVQVMATYCVCAYMLLLQILFAVSACPKQSFLVFAAIVA